MADRLAMKVKITRKITKYQAQQPLAGYKQQPCLFAWFTRGCQRRPVLYPFGIPTPAINQNIHHVAATK